MKSKSALDSPSRFSPSFDRPRSQKPSTDLRLPRDFQLYPPSSISGSVIIHSDLSSALTSPRLYEQYTVHAELAAIVDPGGITDELKNAFVAVKRNREAKILATVFEEMRLETVVSRLARKYYENRLKFRLFRVFRWAVALPKGLNFLYQALFSKAWRTYKKKTKKRSAAKYRLEKLGGKAISVWKYNRKLTSNLYQAENNVKKRFFQCWLLGVRFSWLQTHIRNRYLTKIIAFWHHFSSKISKLRRYFHAFHKVCKTKRAFRISKMIRLNAIRNQLENRMRARMFKFFVETLKQSVKLKFSSYVQSSVKLHNYKLNLASRILQAWLAYISRSAPPIIPQRKVFRAFRIALIQKRTRLKLCAKVNFRAKNRFFGEWLGLLRSGKYVKIRSAEGNYSEKLAKTAMFALVANLNEARYKSEIAENHVAKRELRRIFAHFRKFFRENRTIRYLKSFIVHKKGIYFSSWVAFYQKNSEFHHQIISAFNSERQKHLIFIWRKATLLSQMQDDQKVASFLIHFRLKSFFNEIKELIFKKRIIEMHRSKVKRILLAWREVSGSVQYYHSVAAELTLPPRLRDRGDRSFVESDSDDLRNSTIGKANISVKSWLKESKLQSRLRNIRKKGELRTAKWCFEAISDKVLRRRRENHARIQCENRVMKGIFMKWIGVVAYFREIIRKSESVRRFIMRNRFKTVVDRLEIYTIKREKELRSRELAKDYWNRKNGTLAIRKLAANAGKYSEIREIRVKFIKNREIAQKNSVFQTLKMRQFYSKIRYCIEKNRKLHVKKRCFREFFQNKAQKSHKNEIYFKQNRTSLRNIIKFWGNLTIISQNLSNFNFQNAIKAAKHEKNTSFKWISDKFLDYKRRKTALNRLKLSFEAQKRAIHREMTCSRYLDTKKAKETFKSWVLFSLSCRFIRIRVANRLKFALKRLSRNRIILRFLTDKTNRTLNAVIFAWKNVNFHTSTHQFLSYSSGSFLAIRPQTHQIFAVLKRKTTWKKHVANWIQSREKRKFTLFWLKMKQITSRLISAREKSIHIHKSLILELKQIFKQNRLSFLFRQRKLALKSLNALRLEVAFSQSSKRASAESVFLYLPREDADKIEELLANESSLVDQRQIDLENELSMLTYQLENTPEKQSSRKGKPSEMVRSAAVGKSPDNARRRVKEAEQDVMKSYVQYRHSMRAIDKVQCQSRLFSPSIDRASPISDSRPRKAGESIGRPRKSSIQTNPRRPESSLSDVLKLSDLEEWGREKREIFAKE